ncbi:hypothetical protein EJ08DRAFT_671682 [Tothia fuscella]|uniref:Sodium/calcium exchanger membrane region domain-containing protein n=1 Tax=Tothia fuscella TaxID=1048955 RepID=A0A9P4NMN7_9PEZI|nr:hypothetical protein EJ08DRAFT_671682 [Tothia fuscella]
MDMLRSSLRAGHIQQNPIVKAIHHLLSDLFSILARNYVHVLLVFVPVGIIGGCLQWSPCAFLVGYLSEDLPARRSMGPKWGGLMEETLGNTVELMVCIAALTNNEIQITQNIVLGTILAEILWIPGVCAAQGIILNREPTFNSKAAATMCSIAAATVSFVMIPAVLFATLAGLPTDTTDRMVILSRGISLFLILLYVMYMTFRLQPQADFLDEECTSDTAVKSTISLSSPSPNSGYRCFYLIESIADVAESAQLNSAIVSVIFLPLAFSCAELYTAVWVTYRNTMDLAINVVMGSVIQVPLLVMPLLVMLGWATERPMTLHFFGLDSIVLFLSIFVVALHIQEGKSTYVACAICWAT